MMRVLRSYVVALAITSDTNNYKEGTILFPFYNQIIRLYVNRNALLSSNIS